MPNTKLRERENEVTDKEIEILRDRESEYVCNKRDREEKINLGPECVIKRVRVSENERVAAVETVTFRQINNDLCGVPP